MSHCNDIAIRRFLTEQFLEVADQRDGTLLDLGCGHLPYRPIYQNLFKRVVTADLDLRTVIDARSDAQALGFKDQSFDVVLFAEVIEHVPNPAVAMSEIARVLKPKGVVLLTWPFMHPLHELPHDYARYTEFGMANLLEGAGLKIELLTRRGDVVTLLFALVEQFISNGVEFCVRLPVVGRPVFRPVQTALRSFLRVLWQLYLGLMLPARRFQPPAIGSNLKGPINYMALWTIGYCARVRKR